MRGVRYKKEEVLVREALRTLNERFGPVETMRFLKVVKGETKGDIVKWHREWQNKLNKEKFFWDIFEVMGDDM